MQVPKAWREELKARGISTGRSKLHHSVTAADGTRKFLLQLHDGLIVETVGIPADACDKPRLTACVSSQVQCSPDAMTAFAFQETPLYLQLHDSCIVGTVDI